MQQSHSGVSVATSCPSVALVLKGWNWCYSFYRYKYFPDGGLTSHKDGKSYETSASKFLKKIGKY